jgi:hypothetical protein
MMNLSLIYLSLTAGRRVATVRRIIRCFREGSLQACNGKIWELEGDFDSESESWDSAPQAPRSKETGAPQARGTLADLGFLVRVWRVKAVFFSRISALVGVKLRE